MEKICQLMRQRRKECKQRKVQKWRAETEPTTKALDNRNSDLTNKHHISIMNRNDEIWKGQEDRKGVGRTELPSQ